MKKLLSIIVTLCLLSTMVTPAIAVSAEPSVPPELIESETRIVGSSKDENFEYFSVIDTEAQTAQAIHKDLSTGEYIFGPKISFAYQEEGHIPMPCAPDYSTTHQDTFLNYEYDIYTSESPIEWNLERPDIAAFSQYYFMVYENSSNLYYLERFQNSVDNLNDQELLTIGLIGMAVFKTAVALITTEAAISTYGMLSAEAVVAIAEALDAGDEADDAIATLVSYYNHCSTTYRNVLNHTDNIHY